MAKAKKKQAPQAQSDEVARKRERLIGLLRWLIETDRAQSRSWWLIGSPVFLLVRWDLDGPSLVPPHAARALQYDLSTTNARGDQALADLNEIASTLEGEARDALLELRERWNNAAPTPLGHPTLDLVARALRALGPRDQFNERELDLLTRLAAVGPQSVGKLAEFLKQSDETAGKVLAHLAARGLIERDNERAPYRLTDAGKRALR
jgi:hypothetical protein